MLYVFIEENPHIGGPIKVKPMFKGQMHLKILSYYLTRRKAGHQILGLSLPLHDPEQEFLSDFAPWVPLFCHAISGCHWNLRSEQDCGVWGAEAGWLSDSALRLAET